MFNIKSFIQDEKAIATIWTTALVALFGFSIIYAISYDVVCTHIMNAVITMSGSDMPQAFFDNIDKFRTLYNVLPFVFLFGIIMWMYVESQKEVYRT